MGDVQPTANISTAGNFKSIKAKDPLLQEVGEKWDAVVFEPAGQPEDGGCLQCAVTPEQFEDQPRPKGGLRADLAWNDPAAQVGGKITGLGGGAGGVYRGSPASFSPGRVYCLSAWKNLPRPPSWSAAPW